MIVSDRERLILRVALGADENDVPRRDREEVAFMDGSEDDALCQALVLRGLLEPAPRSELFPNFNPYRVTRDGRACFAGLSSATVPAEKQSSTDHGAMIDMAQEGGLTTRIMRGA